jgi:predicted nucleic acid-binding protein
LLFSQQVQQVTQTSDEILRRAEGLEKSGFNTYDAIHLASEEQAGVDVFLTTDDQILKVVSRNEKLLPFRIENPVKCLEEVLK